jgi:hypothetical protein
MLLFALASGACTQDASLSHHQTSIVGGSADSGDPAVGVMLADDPRGKWLCSGTLITPTIFLTAGHCVDPGGPATTYKVYFGQDLSTASPSDFITAREAHFNPLFDENDLPAGHDCSVLLFASAVPGVAPIPYNRRPLGPSMLGRPARIVGYGDTDGQAGSGAGAKRKLDVLIGSFTATEIAIGQAGHSTCSGDSGGPLLTNIGGVETIIGVTSYGPIGCTGAGEESRVDVCASWLDSFSPDSTPPTISIASPHPGDSVPSGFDVSFAALDNVAVTSVDIYVDGSAYGTVRAEPWRLAVPAGALPAGTVRIKGIARDGNGNQADSGEIAITVRELGTTPGDLGTPCTENSDCTGGGFCGAGNCTRLCASTTPCPDDFQCLLTSQYIQQCVRTALDSGGCIVSVRPSTSTGGFAVLAFVLIIVIVGAASRSFMRSRRARAPGRRVL